MAQVIEKIVRSKYPPRDTRVLWLDENTGTIKQFKNGKWNNTQDNTSQIKGRLWIPKYPNNTLHGTKSVIFASRIAFYELVKNNAIELYDGSVDTPKDGDYAIIGSYTHNQAFSESLHLTTILKYDIDRYGKPKTYIIVGDKRDLYNDIKTEIYLQSNYENRAIFEYKNNQLQASFDGYTWILCNENKNGYICRIGSTYLEDGYNDGCYIVKYSNGYWRSIDAVKLLNKEQVDSINCDITKELVDKIGKIGEGLIQASQNTTISTTKYGAVSVPKLTVDNVTKAYNQIVSGYTCTITDATGNYHLVVNQADSLNGSPAIGILYYNTIALTYEVEDNDVTIHFTEL